MRFVLCDDDEVYTDLVESMLNGLGHAVVGVAVTTAESVALVRVARPDAVVLDLSMGVNSDFDVVAAAQSVGAIPIVFSQHADDAILSGYDVRPAVVFKPDLAELEQVISRLGFDAQQQVVAHDRRVRPSRAAAGRPPTNVNDAQAFYESVNEASAGDALLSIDMAVEDGPVAEIVDLAERVRAVLRSSDRLLAWSSGVRVFLPGGDDTGAAAVQARLREAAEVPPGATIRSVILGAGEDPGVAFERLRSGG